MRLELTKSQLRRAAHAARQLASEICEGTAPAFDRLDYRKCAAGVVLERTIGRPVRGRRWERAAFEIDRLVGEALTDALIDGHHYQHVIGSAPGTAVFPLLWLGDVLENAPKAPTKNLPEEA